MSCPVTPVAVVAVQQKSSDDSTGWRSKTTTVLSRTSFLVNTPEMSDVKFIFKTKEGTEDTIIYGHKFILAMASPVFHKMFFNQNPEILTHVDDKVDMNYHHGFTAEAFLAFIQFLYTDEIRYEATESLSIELLIGILNCTDLYDVPYFKKYCVKQLGTIMMRTNVLQILEAAVLLREIDLARSALQFIGRNLKFVIESEEILSVKKETLFAILNQDLLDLDEYVVLELTLKWAEHECKRESLEPTAKNKRKVLGPLFFEIRYALLTSDIISELVASNFLTLKESLDICLAVHNPDHLIRTKTTPDGSKFRRNAPEVEFKSKRRYFGLKMEFRTGLAESKKMEEKWKAENKLDYWKSLAKVQANLFMGGFPRDKTENELEKEIKQAGFNTDLYVNKLIENRGRFHVQFLYNPSVYECVDLLNPAAFGFDDVESINISEWID